MEYLVCPIFLIYIHVPKRFIGLVYVVQLIDMFNNKVRNNFYLELFQLELIDSWKNCFIRWFYQILIHILDQNHLSPILLQIFYFLDNDFANKKTHFLLFLTNLTTIILVNNFIFILINNSIFILLNERPFHFSKLQDLFILNLI